jgi:hypothetical protein
VAQINENTYRINDLEAIIAGYQLTDLPTGAVASVTDGTALLMPSLKVGIEPAQDLHGYDHPWNGGAGKNKLNSTVRASQTVNGITSEIKADNTVIASGTSTQNGDINISVTPFTLKAGTYTISINGTDTRTSALYFWLYAGGYKGPFTIKATNHSATFTTSEDYDVTSVMFRTGQGGEVNINARIQLESGSTATTYSPYSNICPISGWTAANVVVSPTTLAEDGTTYTIEFKDSDNPLTVYGGTLDVTSGELTVTDAHIASYDAETLPSTWISDRDVYAEGTTPTTGAEVVYKLANSVTYHLAPTQVRTLVGNNNIWTDTGDIIEGKYFKSLT